MSFSPFSPGQLPQLPAKEEVVRTATERAVMVRVSRLFISEVNEPGFMADAPNTAKGPKEKRPPKEPLF